MLYKCVFIIYLFIFIALLRIYIVTNYLLTYGNDLRTARHPWARQTVA